MQKEQQNFEAFIKSKPIRSSALPISPKQQLLPLNSLDWKTFELLCCQLVKLEPDTDHAHLHGVPGDDQKGIDIVAKKKVDNSFQTWCYQCKDHEKFTPAQFKKAIEALKYGADRYVFCIACKATAKLCKIASDNNVDLWDAQEISFKLKDHPELVADFFHPVWVEVFCVTKELPELSIPTIYSPPQPNALFVGRKAELESLYEHLGKQKVIIIEGIGGMGKTQLVLQALQNTDDMPTVWLDVESCRDILDLKNTLLRVFSKDDFEGEPEQALLDLLSMQSLRIVFDGLDRIATSQWDQVTDFLLKLVRFTRKTQFLITTQIESIDLDFEAFRLTLQPLSSTDSAQILNSIHQQAEIVKNDTSSLDWLLYLCDGHPLSLRLVLGLLRYYKDTKAVADRLRASHVNAFEDPRRNRQKTSTSLAVCLEVAYFHFTHRQRRLLQFVSCFPVGCIDIYARHWQELEDYEANLAELTRFFFVEMRDDPLRETQRLYLLNPIRHFVRSKWKVDAPSEAMDIQIEAAEAIAFHASVVSFTHLNTKINAMGLDIVDLDLPNYMAAMRYATEGEKRRKAEDRDFRECLVIKLCLAYDLMSYFFVRVFLPYGISFLRAGIDAGEQLGDEHLVKVMDLYNVVFSLERRLNQYSDRDEVETKLATIASQITNTRVRALASRNQGDLAMSNRQYAKAIEFYTVAENYFRSELRGTTTHSKVKDKEDNLTYLQGTLALILADKGRAYEYQRAYQSAIAHYTEALDLLKRIQDSFNIGSIYFHLGNCYGYIGETATAIEHYQEAVNKFAYIDNGQYLSNSLCEIGELLERTDVDLTSLLTPFSEDMVILGLNDTGKEIAHLLRRWKTDSSSKDDGFLLDIALLRKIFAMVKLVSLTQHAVLLEAWASESEKEIVSPLLNTISIFALLGSVSSSREKFV